MNQPNLFLPSWHLEDIARDFKDREAAAIINAYCLGMHPWIVQLYRGAPRWTAAASPGDIEIDRLVILPQPSRNKLPAGWLAQAEEQGVIILTSTENRAESLQAVQNHPRLKHLIGEQFSDVADGTEDGSDRIPWALDNFAALGTNYLLLQLLSQSMYHYDNISENRFNDFLCAAAEAAIKGETASTEQYFQQACEQLLESRENFYGVQAHLIDLCLTGSDLTGNDLSSLTEYDHVYNILLTGERVNSLANSAPEAVSELKSMLAEQKVCLLGGEWSEKATPLLPLAVLEQELRRGLSSYREHLGIEPQVWMRMRYGLSSQLPLMLTKFGIKSAYHIVLDDGLYPDDEQSHFAWEGRSSSVVQAISRLPLSVENAANLLKIPERLAESMNHDHLASVVLARWPKLKNPWLQDLLTIHRYAPVLGQFSRLNEFLLHTEDSGHYTNNEQRLYRSPFLEQLTGRKQTDVLSRISSFWQLFQQLQVLATLETIAKMLGLSSETTARTGDLQELTDLSEWPGIEVITSKKNEWQTISSQIAEQIGQRLIGQGSDEPGYLIFNPLPHSRTCCLKLAYQEHFGQTLLPQLAGNLKQLQPEKDFCWATVELPACGYAAIKLISAAQQKLPRVKAALAGDLFLQNEFFHIQIDPENGGIQRLRVHGSTENLLSQRIVFRRDGAAGVISRNDQGWGNPAEPSYSRMIADSITIASQGAVRGAIEVQGRLLAPENEKLIAHFKQTYTVCRGLRYLQIDVELDPSLMPAANVDRSYYAVRFAWGASAAMLRGTLQHSQYPAGDKRIESIGPLEIDDGEHRLLLYSPDCPFHQRTEMRMLDSLLIVQGETKRKFRYFVAIDPIDSCLQATSAVVEPFVHAVPRIPQRESAWLLHLSAANVQLLRSEYISDFRPTAASENVPVYQFDLVESAGRHTVVRLSAFKPPRKAWELNLTGNIVTELNIKDDQVVLECLPCDYTRVVVQF